MMFSPVNAIPEPLVQVVRNQTDTKNRRTELKRPGDIARFVIEN